MLAVRNLESGYGRIRIVSGISLTVRTDEYLGVLGHNGMGKTTLLRTLMGLIPTTSGTVEFDGVDVTTVPTHQRTRRGLGYIPQGREIFPTLTVRENLTLAALKCRSDNGMTVGEILDRIPRLHPLLNRLGRELSGGEQQLLALARCLCGRPKMILLDEPTEGIQPSIIDEIIDLLRRLREDDGLSMLLVEQNLNFIQALSDRVLIIQRGAIVGDMDPQRLHDPDVIDEFIGTSAVAE